MDNVQQLERNYLECRKEHGINCCSDCLMSENCLLSGKNHYYPEVEKVLSAQDANSPHSQMEYCQKLCDIFTSECFMGDVPLIPTKSSIRKLIKGCPECSAISLCKISEMFIAILQDYDNIFCRMFMKKFGFIADTRDVDNCQTCVKIADKILKAKKINGTSERNEHELALRISGCERGAGRQCFLSQVENENIEGVILKVQAEKCAECTGMIDKTKKILEKGDDQEKNTAMVGVTSFLAHRSSCMIRIKKGCGFYQALIDIIDI